MMPTPDRRSRRQAELARGAFGEAADALAHRPHARADARVAVGGEISEADARK